MEKLNFLHTFKAHHRILRQILCYNTKFQINLIKFKDAMLKTPKDAKPYILTFKDSDMGMVMIVMVVMVMVMMVILARPDFFKKSLKYLTYNSKSIYPIVDLKIAT